MGVGKFSKVSKEGVVDSETDQTYMGHLYSTPSAAIADGARTIPIAYNSTGLDLNQWINVHYDINNNKDELWGGQSTIARQNFSLKYELIGYISGTNKTNESGHATIKDNILTVHKYNSTEVGNQQIVGRKPLIRVTLIDNTKNQIAAYGYICAEIVGKTDMVVVETLPVKTDAYYQTCASEMITGPSYTWDEIENQLLGQIDMSKEDFEAKYTFERGVAYLKSGDNFVNTITVKENNQEVTYNVSSLYGYPAYEGWEDGKAHQTNVIKWYMFGSYAYNNFVVNKKSSMEIYMKFYKQSYDDPSKDPSPIYVKLTWTPSGINAAPSASIDNADKKPANWHAKDSRTAGYDEVHMQIGSPTSNSTVAHFNGLTLASVFNADMNVIVAKDLEAAGYGKIKTSDASGSGLAQKVYEDGTVAYTFAAAQDVKSYTVDGKTYTMEVSKAGDAISAYTKSDKSDIETIATITSKDGVITVNESSTYAQTIINSASSADAIKAGEQLTLTVAVNVTTCEAVWGGDATTVTLSNNKFNVKVLKPLFITAPSVTGMKWNQGKSQTKDLSLKFTDFVKYTPKTFADNAKDETLLTTLGGTKDKNYVEAFFTFYSINTKDIDVDIDNATTNYASSTPALIDTENDFAISYDAKETPTIDAKTGDITVGTITLTQKNEERTNEFKVWIPVTIHYALGDLKSQIEVTVSASN